MAALQLMPNHQPASNQPVPIIVKQKTSRPQACFSGDGTVGRQATAGCTPLAFGISHSDGTPLAFGISHSDGMLTAFWDQPF